MDSQYKLLSELVSDQPAFIPSPKTSLANYWGGIAPQCLRAWRWGYWHPESGCYTKIKALLHVRPRLGYVVFCYPE